MTSMPNALASRAWSPKSEAALEQRANLLDAVWADARDSHSVLRTILPQLPPLADTHQKLDDYSVDAALCPDEVWRVCRDDVGHHPGAVLLEAPLLPVFLPVLCRVLLGQTLLLPSMPAWWLGDAATLPILVGRPDRFRLRNAFDPYHPGIALADLSAADRCRLQQSIGPALDKYVAVLNLRLHEQSFALADQPILAGVRRDVEN